MGIVGMANVGKSSTFNFLCKQSVPAENYPFCTIDPNTAIVKVPDQRFEILCGYFKPEKIIHATLQITDIAGLVKGASEGAGLGNEFLSHIKSVDGIYQVVRAFEHENIIHTEGKMDPIRDLDIIKEELAAKDLQYVEKQYVDFAKKAKRNPNPDLKVAVTALEKSQEILKKKQWIRFAKWNKQEVEFLNKHMLLTAKPVTYLINQSKEDYTKKQCKFMSGIKDWVKSNSKDSNIIEYSVEHEKEIEENKADPQTSQVNNIIHDGYKLLNLIHFFTVGTDENRCWTIRRGSKAPEAASAIHTDFEKFFVSAEVISFENLNKLGEEAVSKMKKNMSKEGKEYIVKDGDIVHFKSKKQ